MNFEQLYSGKILKRYKRFLADIELDENTPLHKKGEVITAHLANTGSMKSCWGPLWPVKVSLHNLPSRKLKYSLEWTFNGSTWIGVNTSLTNKIVQEALENGKIKGLSGYSNIRPEIPIDNTKRRLDFLLSGDPNSEDCYLEVKNVTLVEDDKRAFFPDAVTTRGQAHLETLIDLKKKGYRAAIFFVIAREDALSFSSARFIDPDYANILEDAVKNNVEVFVYNCQFSENNFEIFKKIDWNVYE